MKKFSRAKGNISCSGCYLLIKPGERVWVAPTEKEYCETCSGERKGPRVPAITKAMEGLAILTRIIFPKEDKEQ